MPTHQPIDLTPLDRVMDRCPLTAEADALVIDAIALLNQSQADCILIVQDGQLLGIFTERDVVRLVVAKRDFSHLKLFEVMTKQVITLTPSNSAQDVVKAFALMRQHRLRQLPIVDQTNRLLGLVTLGSAIFQKSVQEMVAFAGQQAILNECKRSEAALIESEQRFHTMADTAPVMIWVAGTDKFCNYFNQPWLQFTGRTLEQEIGNGWTEGVHRDDFQRCIDTYFTAFDARQPFTMEYRLRRFDGKYRWLLDTGNPRFNGDGSFAGYIGSCIDIGDRKQVEDKLRSSEEQLRLALDFSHTGGWDWQIDINKVTWNDNFSQLLGLNPGEVEASYQTWRDRVHPEDIVQVEQVINHALATRSYYETEYRTIHPDGSIRYLAARGQGIYNQSGQVVRMVGVLFDISDRQQAEAALRESEQRYATLAQAVPVGIFRTDPEGHCVYVNQRWTQITGLSLLQAWQDGWAQAIHPDDRERVFTQWYECARQNLPFQSEYRFQRADGVVTWVFGQAVAERGTDDELIGYVGTITDISEQQAALRDRKRVEAALRQYERIVSATPDGVALVDRNYTFRLINQTYLLLHGKYSEEIIGHTISELLGEDVFTSLIKPLMDRCLAGETIRYEAWFTYAKAGRRFIGVTYAPYIEMDSTISGIVVNTRDLTKLKQAEEKIVEQAMLLDVATDAILVRGLDSKILYWNNGAENLYGWSSKEALGKNTSEILYKEITPQVLEALQTVIDRGSWQGELAKINKEGKELIVTSRWTLVRDEQGKPKSILSVDTDITEQKKLAAQFLRAQRLESIGTLAGGIAHDLNNVLAPILMSVQLLQLKYPEDKNRSLLNLLENNVKRGAALVKQVLSFARGLEGDRTIVQVKHLILEIANIIKETFPKSIELHTNIASDLETVLADATQLHQVLMNLVVNARDAMPKGGSLTISATNATIDQTYAQTHIEAKVGSYVVVTITDTGVGIAPEIMERIFDPFFTTKEVGKGTGLGLSTSLGIIKSHNGFLEVDSEVGKGSSFKVYLPMGKQTSTQLLESPEPLAGRGELILVVDDETTICSVIKTTLESYNYRVLIANDGIEALDLYAQHAKEIGVVLLDMMMPKMDGFTTLRTLQAMNNSVAIIATSGLALSDQVNPPQGKGAKAFLSKPYTTQELLQTLQAILRAK